MDKKEYNKNYNKENKEKISIQKREYYIKHRDIILDKKRIYVSKNKELIKEQDKKSREKHKTERYKKHYIYYKNRRQTDNIFRFKCNIRTKLYQALKNNKKHKSVEYLGCSLEFLRTYIEDLFLDNMTWDNYGQYPDGWDIDHIIPLCSAKTLEELIPLLHYTNLQPLNSKVNRDIKKHHF